MSNSFHKPFKLFPGKFPTIFSMLFVIRNLYFIFKKRQHCVQGCTNAALSTPNFGLAGFYFRFQHLLIIRRWSNNVLQYYQSKVFVMSIAFAVPCSLLSALCLISFLNVAQKLCSSFNLIAFLKDSCKSSSDKCLRLFMDIPPTFAILNLSIFESSEVESI